MQGLEENGQAWEEKEMINLEGIIKQNPSGEPYTDGARWWTTLGWESYTLMAFKEIMIKIACMRARLHLPGTEKDGLNQQTYSIEDVRFEYDNLIENEQIALRFTHHTVDVTYDQYNPSKVEKIWTNTRRKVFVQIWKDGSYAVFVDGEIQPQVKIFI